MSYYTVYNLTAETITDEQRADLNDWIAEVSALVPRGEDWNGEDTWYDHEEDMRAVSEKFPSALFCLEGHGEDSDDHWRKYFKGGKMQYCPGRIDYDDFDVAKLE